MKKTKIIIPAMGLLLLSTAASITGTVAWFAVNTSVAVEGLNVRAKAEGGIVIAPYAYTPSAVVSDSSKTDSAYVAPAQNAFGASANVGLSVADLYPTSTSNTTAWWHAGSASVDDHTAVDGSYVNLATQTTFESDGKLITGNGSTEAYKLAGQYFQYSQFRVKSTTEVDKYSLYLRSLTVTSATNNSPELNQSLRVAIKVGAVTTFVAPKYTAAPVSPAEPLKWYNGTAVQNATLSYGLTPNVKISADNAVVGDNAVDSPYEPAGVDLQIWVYYEGEDPNCKTINTEGVTIDSLALTFTFATTAA